MIMRVMDDSHRRGDDGSGYDEDDDALL